MILGIGFRNHVENVEIRRRTGVDDVISTIARMKWSWVGHVPRQDEFRWTKLIVQWRPQKRWLEREG